LTPKRLRSRFGVVGEHAEKSRHAMKTSKRTTFLTFSRPGLTDREIDEVGRTLRSDWITTGPRVAELEQAFSRARSAPAALALSSGTAALHLGLIVAGVRPGDSVITTPLTFCSSVHVIEHVGAQPILVDVEPDTLNIDPKMVEEAIEGQLAAGSRQLAESGRRGERPQRRRGAEARGRVRAILPVHLYGHPCDMDAILALASRHSLAVVEDAAHALPAAFNGRTIGAAPGPGVAATVLTAFSFYATKNLTTAEGGMLTGPPELVEEARIWSLHGMNRDAWKRYSTQGSWFYEVTRPGFKYNMTDIQAAIGLQQLKRLPEMQARRREIFTAYNAGLAGLDAIERPTVRPEVEHAWHLYVIRMNLDRLTIDRSRFIEELRARNIGASVHFIPVHLHPYYRDKYGYVPEDFPVAFREYNRLVSLPLYPGMSNEDIRDVIDAVADIVESHRR
jgi:dTDP-4-amino-4,6-dideoxygalactose transaminase